MPFYIIANLVFLHTLEYENDEEIYVWTYVPFICTEI